MDLIKKFLTFLKSNSQNKNNIDEYLLQCVFCGYTNTFPNSVSLVLGYFCKRCKEWNMIS